MRHSRMRLKIIPYNLFSYDASGSPPASHDRYFRAKYLCMSKKSANIAHYFIPWQQPQRPRSHSVMCAVSTRGGLTTHS